MIISNTGDIWIKIDFTLTLHKTRGVASIRKTKNKIIRENSSMTLVETRVTSFCGF